MFSRNKYEDEVRLEIENLFANSVEQNPFGESRDELIEDFVKIGAFLMEEARVLPYLHLLEKNLKDALALKGFDVESKENTKGWIKILRNLIVEHLKQKKFGFSEQTAIPVDLLSSEAFENILKNKILIKDSAFRHDLHGEFTHMIQLYLIALAIDKGDLKLNFKLSDIYSKSGVALDQKVEENEKSEKLVEVEGELDSESDEEDKLVSPWKVLFDLPPNDELKFRCPELLNDYLVTTTDEQLSTLQFLISYRTSLEYKQKHDIKLEDDSYTFGYYNKIQKKYNHYKDNNPNLKYFIDEKNIGKNVLVSSKKENKKTENNLNNDANTNRKRKRGSLDK